MRAFLKEISYWKVSVVRCCAYMIMVAGSSFLTLTESFTGDEWKTLSLFEQGRIYLTCGIGSLGALVAFLDQSLTRLLNNKNPITEKPKTSTEVK